jgi:hypothetical protein
MQVAAGDLIPGRSRTKSGLALLLALLCAGSMWFYVDLVLIGYQVRDAAAHERPRGNLSDLYPRWLGAKELLLHHRNPYSQDISVEIQQGYYGRALDPTRPNDPKDEQGFAYPVYVTFLLAPLVALPFHHVQILFHWLLLGLTVASVYLWLFVIGWRLSVVQTAAVALLTLGSFPGVQGIKLQQLTLLLAALLAAAAACVVSGNLLLAGALLALATIKPQLTWLLAAWLLVWAISNWRERRHLVYGFGIVMLLLLGGSEILLPGWLHMFVDALARYHRYTQNQSVLDQLLPWAFAGKIEAGKIVAGIAVLICAGVLWLARREAPDTPEFAIATVLVMALTVLVVPMSAPYNQVLLLPVVLVLVRDRDFFLSGSKALLLGWLAGSLALAWPWIASAGLSALYLFGSPASAQRGWKWPFFSTFAIPVLIFGLIFLQAQSRVRPRLSGLAEPQSPKDST